MSHPILSRHLKKGTQKPVYLFYGEEEFLIRRALASLEAWLQQHDELAAKISLEAAATPLADVLSAARSPQLWGGRQLVVYWGVDHLKASDLAPLAKYLAAPSSWTCLILVAVGLKAKDVQARKPWRHLLEQEAALAFPRLRERELLGWMEQEAKQQGKVLEPGAARVLVEAVGQNLTDLAQQLEKLILYAGPAAQISAAAAQTLASHSRVRTIFELVDSLGQKQPGEPPSVILVMLARPLRLLLRTQEGLQQGLNTAQLAQELGVLPFVAEKLQRQAADLSAPRLQEQLLRLQEADQQIKTGMAAPQLLLEKVILYLCPLPALRTGQPGH